MSGPEGFVYFIKPQNFVGPIKIGFSATPKTRVLTLMKWSPFPLEIAATTPGQFSLETALHEHFADVHLHHEWFQPVDRLRHGIEALRQGQAVEQAFNLNIKNGSIRKGEARSKVHLTPQWRERRSYRSRLMWLERKLHARAPEDVENILHCSNSQHQLTDAEKTRLHEVFGDPSQHLIPWGSP
jgi:hypothetical protein